VAHVTGRNGGAQNGLETFVNDLFRVAYRHGLYVPPSTTLLIKAIVTIEGVARSLNPNLNVVSAALPIVLRSLRPRWLRWNFWKDVGSAVAAPIGARARAPT
jgi:ubiquinone biosynthesis protein